MNNQRIFTVSEINRYIKNLFEEDLLLSGLWIQGEISNFKPHRSGHIYFTLKDEQGSIACVMFRSYAQNLAFIPEDGMSVIVKGYVSLYEKSGQYQLYVQTIEPAGKGALQLAYEQLKSKLHEKGFFDQERKKRIPFFPRTVGIVTSDTGAAIRDIIQIAKRRNPSVSLVIYPVLVQGKEAAASIAHGIEQFNRWNKAEVLIVGRGGGSLEDLWAFNEEVVAQAIFDSKIPIISAVGHETDFTIADFVADLRAPTPSAAAELAIPSQEDLKYRVLYQKKRLYSLLQYQITGYKEQIVALKNRSFFRHPLELIHPQQQYLDQVEKKLHKNVHYILKNYHTQLQHFIEKLQLLSPLSHLQRGYSIVMDKQGLPITSIHQTKQDEVVYIKMYDGALQVKIEEIKKEGEKQ